MRDKERRERERERVRQTDRQTDLNDSFAGRNEKNVEKSFWFAKDAFIVNIVERKG